MRAGEWFFFSKMWRFVHAEIKSGVSVKYGMWRIKSDPQIERERGDSNRQVEGAKSERNN